MSGATTASLPARSGRAALGSVAAQFSQALASFMLSIVGVRTLSAADFGVLALLLSSLVLATAVMTGLVGDSLTVLDRADDRIRAGLQFWAVTTAAALSAAAFVVPLVTGLLAPGNAALFGLAVGAFVLEDTARRLLMAGLRFWSLVVVDMAYLAAAAAVLGALALTRDHLDLTDFVLALLLGQLVAMVMAVPLLPREERRLAPWRQGGIAPVARFGAWRALQQGVRPAALTCVRVIVISAVGAAGLGRLETARVFMSPALLFVQGLSSFLLARSARDRRRPLPAALRRADRTTALLVGVIGLFAVDLAYALPWIGPLLTGSGHVVSRVAVAGWACLAVAQAASAPYANVAAVRVLPSRVLALRVLDTLISLGAVTLLLLLRPEHYLLVPFGLALGGFAGSALLRWVGLRGEPVARHQPVAVAS